MRYNGCPFNSEAVKVCRCLRWSSQTVIPYVLSCWVVFPVFAVWNLFQNNADYHIPSLKCSGLAGDY